MYSDGLLDDRRIKFGNTTTAGSTPSRTGKTTASERSRYALVATSIGGVPTDIDDIRHPYVMLDLEIIARYDEKGCFVETIQTRRLLSLIDNADGFIYGTNNATRLEILRGGTDVEGDRQPNGAMRQKILYPQPLQRGETANSCSKYETENDGLRPEWDLVSQIFHVPTRRFW